MSLIIIILVHRQNLFRVLYTGSRVARDLIKSGDLFIRWFRRIDY